MGSTPQRRGRPPARDAKNASNLPNRLRIIGGSWRGARLQFPALASIRPTPDRVRETLFNWLQQIIPGARCLDLFAGSGALGLEALSRGAQAAVFVDNEPLVGRYLRETLERLKSTAGEVYVCEAEQFLRRAPEAFDVVFLDPPFASATLANTCKLLESQGWLKPGAYIYLESSAAAEIPVLPLAWQLLRSKQAGQVGYYLVRRLAASPAQDRSA